jgi:hypothetical protein
MLNHGNNKNNNIPKQLLLKKIEQKFIILIHQKIKWRNNLRIVF